jgi:acyl-CoA synthetase (AMP-forming)/AMP-acid ligase II
VNGSACLLPALYHGEASIEAGGERLAGDELSAAVGGVARQVAGARRVGIAAAPGIGTLVAVAGVLAAGGTAIPFDPLAGRSERDNVLRDAAPDIVLEHVDLTAADSLPPSPPIDDSPALILYTSGSTGPPKGAVIPRRAVVANLDAVAGLWDWTSRDVLTHALPLFHVHGLVFGGLGPLRIGSPLVYSRGYLRPVPAATIYFGVPTQWGSLSASDVRELRGARLLVSGASALTERISGRIAELSGHRVLNRYAMTETLIITSPRADEARPRDSVGRPLPGTQVRLAPVDAMADAGEVQVRGPNLFTGYLGLESPMDQEGWFSTGDIAEWLDDGSLRLVGRKDTDLIKTGGHRVGAGEVESALLAHPGVADAAVVGLPDRKLGQRVAAWIVASGLLDRAEVTSFLAGRIAPYKHPQEIHIVDSLPRNALGKVQKRLLVSVVNGEYFATGRHDDPFARA